MKFLPAKNITYKTGLNEQEVLIRLSNFIEPEKTFRSSLFGNKAIKSYEGYVNGQTFSIKRIIRYRNSFLPQINGTIQKDFDGGTLIQIKMRMHAFVIAFGTVWCSGVAFVFLFLLIDMFKQAKFQPAIFIPLGMLFFFFLMVEIAFGYERDKAKGDLRKLFDAEIVNNTL